VGLSLAGREGGIWGRGQGTKSGRALLTDRAYAFVVSGNPPPGKTDDAAEKLPDGALTNRPRPDRN
jgi:hypothetical protein